MTQKAFGVPIIENGKVPDVVLEILTRLELLQAEERMGIFRVAGNSILVNALVERYNNGEENVLKETTNVDTLSSLLKLYLRTLPDSLTTAPLYDQFLLIPDLDTKKEKIDHLFNLIHKRLPTTRKLVLQCIIKFLNSISRRSQKNYMNTSNLGIIFGNNFFRVNSEITSILFEDSRKVQKVTTFMINNYEIIFEKENKTENEKKNVSADQEDEKEKEKEKYN
ncbi:rho gtpase-activating protein 68f [Anaeramoeba flamelloides]|uniref:Rho gtpase-activating protein 68f n=1 Tax=Anaeramoeba flamelloides TaxID=1746091 RepID=A0AAV7YJU5_9EUKA|nr:rho gtpase-activating protein 68f [Anaeramoeba flamelloides]